MKLEKIIVAGIFAVGVLVCANASASYWRANIVGDPVGPSGVYTGLNPVQVCDAIYSGGIYQCQGDPNWPECYERKHMGFTSADQSYYLCAVRQKGSAYWKEISIGRVGSCSTSAGQDPESGECEDKQDPPGGSCSAAAAQGGFAGNPISISSGHKFETDVDFLSAVDGGIKFSRNYNYRAGGNELRALWVFDYSQSLSITRLPAGGFYVRAVRPDNSYIYFKGDPYVGFSADSDVTERLVAKIQDGEVSGFVLFDGLRSEEYDSAGKLKVITFQNGLLQRVSEEGNVRRVMDSYGNSIDIVLENGYVKELRFAGGTVVYGYDPVSKVLNKISYFDVQGALLGTKEYRYDQQHAYGLAGVYDERGLSYAAWAYDSSGRAIYSGHGVKGVDDKRSEEFRLHFASDGTTTVTNPFGKTSIYSFQNVQGVKKITSIEGRISSYCAAADSFYSYDANGFQDKVTDWEGNVTDYDYSALGLVEVITEGLKWTDGTRTATITTPETRATELDWHETTRQIVETRAPGLTTHYDYWPNNRLKQLTQTDTTNETTVFGNSNGQQRIWKYGYTYFNGTDLPVDVLVDTLTIDGPLSGTSDKTVYRYNQQGHLLSVTNALNQAVQYSDYNGRGQPQMITDANGVVTTLGYHPRGWLETARVKAPGGNTALDSVTQYTWYPNGTLEQLTFPDGSFLHYEYNDARHLIEIRNNLDEQITFEPNAMGDWTEARTYSASADMRRLQTRAFDELGRLMDLFGNNGQHTHYGYDTNSNLASIVENGTDRTLTTTLNHDSLNRLKEVLKPVTTEKNGAPTTVDVNTSYLYDSADNLTRVTDPKGNATRYRYNGFGERIEQTSPDTGVTQYGYNAQGNLSNQQDARGVRLTYHYDLLGRLTRIQYAQTSQDVRYYYDEVDATVNPYAKGRLTRLTDPSGNTRFRYDHRGNLTILIQVIGGKTYSTQYRYNLANNLTQIIFPGGRLVNYERNDALGRVSAVTTQQSATTTVRTAVSGIQYQPFGPVTGYVHGNGLTRQVPYDLDYRIDRISVAGAGTTKPLDLTYGYDAFDNIQQMLNGADATRSESFIYDDLHRLQHAYGSYGTNTNHVRYEYDPIGNRTLQAFGQGNQFHTSESYSYNATNNRLNQVTSTNSSGTQVRNLQYTAAGNIGSETTFAGAARTYTYNDNNRLIKLVESGTTTGTYQQNALGQRVLKTANGKTRHYLYGPQGELLAEASAGTILRHYLYLDGQLVAIVDK